MVTELRTENTQTKNRKEERQEKKEEKQEKKGEEKEQKNLQRETEESDSDSDEEQEKTEEQTLEEVKAWIKKNRNENTNKTYESLAKQYHEYCKKERLDGTKTTSICKMIIEMTNKNRKHTTIKSMIAALTDERNLNGQASLLEDPLIKKTLHASHEKANKDRRQAKIIPHETIVEMLDHLRKTAQKLSDEAAECQRNNKPPSKKLIQQGKPTVRDGVLISTMYVALLRGSEMTNLKKEDVKFETKDGKEVMTISIRKSKTNKKKEEIVIPKAEGNPCLCPVTWIQAQDWIGENEFIIQNTKAKNGNKPISTHTIKFILQRRLKEINKPCEGVTSHSMRRSGATRLFKLGKSLDEIRKQGRWSANSTIPLDYIEIDNQQREENSRDLMGT